MKNLIIILCGIITLISCNVGKPKINKITKKEMSEYNIIQDTIYHNNVKIAYLNLIEWEYFNGKLVQEISASIRKHGRSQALFRTRALPQ